MDGLEAVQARIADIQKLGAPIAPAARPQISGGTTFALALDTATEIQATAATNELAPAESRAPGGYGRLEPPADLVRFGNGQIPANALTPIGVDNHRLYKPAADAFVRMVADAASEGVTIGITDSYRSYDEQVDLAKRKGLYRDGGLAATPGTSNHGWGLATDLDLDGDAQQWMRANGARYGFVEDTPREPWHWAYRPMGGL